MTSLSSSRLIKANDLRGHGGRIAFNFDDLQARCQEQLNAARSEAARILAEAQAAAAELRLKSTQEGREAGRREGLQESARRIEEQAEAIAEARVAERLGQALPAWEQLVRSLAEEKDRWLGEWESTAVSLCVGIAGRIVRRELAAHPERARELMARALELAAGSPQVTVRLHPDDLALLGPQGSEVVRTLSACSEAALVGDATIERGGCLIETRHGKIDATLETQLQRIADELVPAVEPYGDEA